jgi:hypothetical protein
MLGDFPGLGNRGNPEGGGIGEGEWGGVGREENGGKRAGTVAGGRAGKEGPLRAGEVVCVAGEKGGMAFGVSIGAQGEATFGLDVGAGGGIGYPLGRAEVVGVKGEADEKGCEAGHGGILSINPVVHVGIGLERSSKPG